MLLNLNVKEYTVLQINPQPALDSGSMDSLQFSNKPQILRLHELETQERTKFCTDFAMTLNQLLPSSILRKIRSSAILTKAMALCPDLYYTFITVNYCRRRLGEEYTYIAMYKGQHFEQEGVLINKKTRSLITILEIISRHAIVPWLQKNLQKGIGENKIQGDYWGLLKGWAVKLLGSGDEMLANAEWLVLMLFMLNWTKRFTIIERILGISYVYTYKNDQLQDISYKLEGYLILITLVVKLAKHLYAIYIDQKAQRQQPRKQASPPVLSKEDVPESSSRKEKVLCRICYDEMKERSATRCGHLFCWGCIIRSLQMSGECPVCRTRCLPREVVQLRNY